MTYLLDTDTCIGWLNQRHAPLLRKLEQAEPTRLTLCSVVRAELLYGSHRSQRREENFQRLCRFFARFPSLPFEIPPPTLIAESAPSWNDGARPSAATT